MQEKYGQMLTGVNRQAALLYAGANMIGNGLHILTLDTAIKEFIASAGEKFAKKTLWMIGEVSGGARAIKNDLDYLLSIKRDLGEERAIEALLYSYGAKSALDMGLVYLCHQIKKLKVQKSHH